jgi:pSer/pThr/pTyr-binding forkhead associated (FHA) protein
MVLCSVCGSSNDEAAEVCSACGSDLAGAAPVPVEAPTDPESEARATAQLFVKRGGAVVGEPFFIGGTVVVGRYDIETGPVEVDLNGLPEATYVSRRHAEITSNAEGGWTIRDLGSRNGTFVRARGTTGFQRVSGSYPIGDGDEIALGNAQFEFRVLQPD